jgi:hypothetical protein
LIDGLNQTLLDELIIGRKWLVLPWLNEFRCKKKIMDDHPKYCYKEQLIEYQIGDSIQWDNCKKIRK